MRVCLVARLASRGFEWIAVKFGSCIHVLLRMNCYNINDHISAELMAFPLASVAYLVLSAN